MRTHVVPIALALLAGCGPEPKQAVLGEWRSGGERMEFLADGRLLLEHADSNTAIARYEFPEARRLRVRELAAAPADYQVEVSRDSLVLCRAPGECFRFSRGGTRR
jgi:hypothetical protein